MIVGGHGGVKNDGLNESNGGNGGNGKNKDPKEDNKFDGNIGVETHIDDYGNRDSNFNISGFDKDTDMSSFYLDLIHNMTDNAEGLGLPTKLPLTPSQAHLYTEMSVALQTAAQDLLKEGGDSKTIKVFVGTKYGAPVYSTIHVNLN